MRSGKVSSRSPQRRREIRSRIALGGAVVLLVAGLTVWLQSRANTGPPPTTAPSAQRSPATTAPEVKPGGTLDPAVKKTAIEFLSTAVARERLNEAWELAAPSLRNAVTRTQWLRGELPIPPFPVRDLEASGFDVVGSSRDKVLLQVFLVPRENTGYLPTVYDMTLEKSGGKWLVSYCLPYGPIGKYDGRGG